MEYFIVEKRKPTFCYVVHVTAFKWKQIFSLKVKADRKLKGDDIQKYHALLDNTIPVIINPKYPKKTGLRKPRMIEGQEPAISNKHYIELNTKTNDNTHLHTKAELPYRVTVP